MSERSVVPKETLKIIAETVGIPNVSDDLAQKLASDVEYRIREIAGEAIKFMNHSKNTRMSTEDVNNALRLRNVESLYGHASKSALQFRRVGETDLFHVDDREYDFKEILDAPLPKCPRDVTFTAHWLAVEGVQPAIPQNPPIIPKPASVLERKKSNVEVPGAVVKNIVKHTLSNELQGYYETITKAIMEANEELQKAALTSLSNDPGVQQLIPYLLQFIEDKVQSNIRKLPVLTSLMKAISSLLHNENIHIETYLHQMMPVIMTCLVGKKLCSNPAEDHWSLRDRAAAIIASVCDRFSDSYTNLRPRISKTLLHAFLDTSKPLSTHYGGIVGLAALGPFTVQVLVLPNISVYMKMLQPELDASQPRPAAQKCYNALLNAAGNCLYHSVSITPNASIASKHAISSSAIIETYYEELYSIFGEALLNFLPSQQAPIS